ncbi:response regulator transcription factor [Chitinophaga oryzae]|uniref:Response regulator transcription factor n=1 Tax=Chitinophaga oryzae TaxID=2725414 RepID=A0AAE6ZGJ3_9BACT|nr:response regulator transcription factor [Chitinophaga oryzae]QJB31807.1 response regulator transcription factor [Chitinophaga oryzae]
MLNQVISVAIVDDHTLFRQGLMRLLAESPEIDIIFDAGNGEEMQQQLSGNKIPEVILMDISMPVMNGHAATAWVKQHYPHIHVLALSMFEEDKEIIKMLKNGAGGYLLKESKTTDVIHAVKTIREHGYFLNELVSSRLLKNIQGSNTTAPIAIKLSANEIRFLQLCCSELTYKEIADQMNLSPHTIDNYRQELFQRLDIKSRTGLVLYAIKHELIKLR